MGPKALQIGLALFPVGCVLFLSLTLLERQTQAQEGSTIYVDGANTGFEDGSAGHPWNTIGEGLDDASDGDTILVAQGTYTENLVITKTVALEGGYDPVDWSRSLRRCTTIDGNQSGRVIEIQSTLSETTVIDGLTITNGDGGINIVLSSVAIQNSKIADNHSTGSGGGIRIDHSFVTITNTLVTSNTADLHDGAIRIISTIAITGPNSIVTITNSTIAYNHADEGRNGICCSLSGCNVVNSIVWGHELEDFWGLGYHATCSDIEMCLPGEGNICEDPRFVDPVNGDYHLRSDSPCIDACTNEDAPETDFEGDPRPLDGDGDGIAATDVGADEYRTCWVQLNDDPTDYTTVQAAVEASMQPTDVVKIAGYCSGVNARAGMTQVVYISKTLTLRGGYTATNWTVSDPVANPTTLDAQGQRRVLYITGNISPTIEGLGITEGDAAELGGHPYPWWEVDTGGGVYVITATVTINNNQLINNTASWGGGMCLSNVKGTISGNSFTINTAADVGGGLYLDSSEATISNNSFTANTANIAAGLFLESSHVTVNGNTIVSNTASTIGEGWGGGLYLSDIEGTISGNSFTANTANGGGGLFLDGGSITLGGNIFTANTANRGGGLHLT